MYILLVSPSSLGSPQRLEPPPLSYPGPSITLPPVSSSEESWYSPRARRKEGEASRQRIYSSLPFSIQSTFLIGLVMARFVSCTPYLVYLWSSGLFAHVERFLWDTLSSSSLVLLVPLILKAPSVGFAPLTIQNASTNTALWGSVVVTRVTQHSSLALRFFLFFLKCTVCPPNLNVCQAADGSVCW